MPDRHNLFAIGGKGQHSGQRNIHGSAIGIIGLHGFVGSGIAFISTYLEKCYLALELVGYFLHRFSLRDAVIAFLMHVDQHGLALQGIQDPGRMIDLAACSGGLVRVCRPPVIISRSYRIFCSRGTKARC